MSKQTWLSAKERLKGVVSSRQFNLWIQPVGVKEVKGGMLILECPNNFAANWVDENYREQIQQALDQVNGGKTQFTLTAGRGSRPAPVYEEEPAQLPLPQLPLTKNGARILNSSFTFDQFVVGECNEFAYTASQALMRENGESIHNLLFIIANTGLGKSHLSQAVGHAIFEHDKNLKVCYMTAEDFVNEMVTALKSNAIERFKNKYRRECDVLLLEEVHFLSGKDKTQQELGWTLDILMNEKKKVVLTSALLPAEIPSMRKGLASRLSSGIIAKLKYPDEETRRRLIEHKALEYDFRLPDAIKEILVQDLTRDIRQLESAVKNMKAQSALLRREINPDLAREIVKGYTAGEQQSLTLDEIAHLVCKSFKVELKALRSKSRQQVHAYPRNIYFYLCRKHTAANLEKIGNTMNRNHSTVVYAFEEISRKVKTHRDTCKQIEFLDKELKAMKG